MGLEQGDDLLRRRHDGAGEVEPLEKLVHERSPKQWRQLVPSRWQELPLPAHSQHTLEIEAVAAAVVALERGVAQAAHRPCIGHLDGRQLRLRRLRASLPTVQRRGLAVGLGEHRLEVRRAQHRALHTHVAAVVLIDGLSAGSQLGQIGRERAPGPAHRLLERLLLVELVEVGGPARTRCSCARVTAT